MRKVIKISKVENFKLLCLFDNGEERVLDLKSNLSDRFAEKILANDDILRNVQIGEFGEIYWRDIGEIIGLNGKVEKCNYDISPEFAYHYSKFIRKIN